MKIGIDIAEVSRIRRAVERNPEFIKRVFTENEQKYIFGKTIKWESAAGFFAVKEAFSKYMGTGIGEISFKDIEVSHNEMGAPYLLIKGVGCEAEVSISHSGDIAVAVVCGDGGESFLKNDEMKELLPKRKSDAHKGECGRIFILGGSLGLTGAVCLSAMGALRSGAGLVTVGTADCQREIVACKLTEAMTVGFASSSGCVGFADREKIKEIAEKSDVFVLGPGIGREGETKDLVLWLIQNVNTKIVLDADGLNAIVANIDVLKGRKGEIVLTPHQGEMSLLCGKTAEEIKNDREDTALCFAKEYGVTVVLKGENTVITDGEKIFVNPTGNSGMATGGSGDVLSGVIGSLIGQGLSLLDGAVLGAYIHGRAGDLAKKDKGEMGLIASDIAENLPYAIKELSGE